jgi:predicted RNase H-like HicB family nuclease
MGTRSYTFSAVLERDPETGYFCISFPALDLATHGRTLEEARAMAHEALELHLEGLLEENMEIPPDILQMDRITVQIPAPVKPARVRTNSVEPDSHAFP